MIVAPSILSADFARLADEVADVAPVVPWIHVDVMDGHYVPNLTLGPPVVRSLRAATDRFLDCHLMITDPRTYAPQFVDAGAESVCFHPEVDDDPVTIIHDLHERGAQAGIAIRPQQPLSLVEELLPFVDLLLVMTVEPGFGGQAFMADVVPKVAQAHAWRSERGARFRLQVDGGIKDATARSTVAAGADTLVAGSAVFDADDRADAVRRLLAVAEQARAAREAGPSSRGTR